VGRLSVCQPFGFARGDFPRDTEIHGDYHTSNCRIHMRGPMKRQTRKRLLGYIFWATVVFMLPCWAQTPNASEDPLFSTFSLVAYDPEAQEWGVVVTSKVPSLRNIVPWAKPGVGAVATQASTNRAFGPDGLDWLAKGKSPDEIGKIFQESDPKIDIRQFGIVDAKGNAFAFTGKKCGNWAGHKTGKNYACQGNILVSEAVVNNTAKAFEETKGSLALRLMAALEAGHKAGGDKRTNKIQSSAMIVVHDNTGGKGGPADYVIDLKVDRSESPVEDLRKLLTEKLEKK
jgi:uncharacterized Ntn-hydrolase superfamily protein